MSTDSEHPLLSIAQMLEQAASEQAASQPDPKLPAGSQQLAQALVASMLLRLASHLRAQAAQGAPAPVLLAGGAPAAPLDWEAARAARAPASTGAQLTEQVLGACERAERAGLAAVQVVDALCWAVGQYGHTRNLRADVVVQVVESVQAELSKRKGQA